MLDILVKNNKGSDQYVLACSFSRLDNRGFDRGACYLDGGIGKKPNGHVNKVYKGPIPQGLIARTDKSGIDDYIPNGIPFFSRQANRADNREFYRLRKKIITRSCK